MRETLKMMKSIITEEEKNMQENTLIEMYRKNLKPSILAYFYVNNYGVIYNASKLYPQLNEQDKASFCLQELDKCLHNFKLNYSTKFITYFLKCYKNRLRTETLGLNMQKRKIIFSIDELNDEITCNDITSEITDENLILDEYKLTDREKKQCILLSHGYKLSEVASILKLSIPRVHFLHKQIKEKVILSIKSL